MSIQRRLYERMSKLDQEKDIQEGPAHQNPLKTAYGGMENAKDTDSYKRYQARLAAERAARAKKATKEEVEQVDELKMPAKDAKGNIKSRKVRSAFAKGASKAQAAGDRAMDKATSKDSDIDHTIKNIDRSLDHEDRRDDRNRKSRKESVEHVEEAKVGDTVHLGHATKGGSGVKGKVVKIDGKNVHIKNDKGAMFKGPMDRVSTTEAYGSDEDRKRREQQDIAALHKKGDKAGIARIMAAKAKEKMRSEAIKYDSAGDSTGTVTGKGKRDRGPKGSRTSGEVRTKYSGHPAYKDDSPGLPIKANDIGRLLKTARKKNTKPYDSRNVRNPRLTRDHVEYTFDESYEPGEKYDEKKHAIQTRTHPHTGKKVNVLVSKRAHGNMVGKFNKPKPTDEGVEDMTPAQNNDRRHRDNPTRKTVAGVHRPSTDAERARYVKKFQADKAGKPGNTKKRRLRDLMLKGRTRTEDVEVTESEVNRKDLRFKRTKLADADERARRDRERQSKTEELLNVAEDMVTEAKDSYEVVAVKGSKVVAKMPAEKMDIKDAVAALTKMHSGADIQVHKNGKIVKMKG